jgi:VWFA-related protein
MPTKALFLSLLMAGTVVAQQQTRTEQAVNVTAIELLAEVRGADGTVPRDLKAEDFTVEEDGVERQVIGVEFLDEAAATAPAAPEGTARVPYMASKANWQIVIYFDTLFSSTINLRKISETLAAQAEELARMGTVEIVVGDLTPSLVVPATRDVETIRNGLKKAVSRGAKDFLTVHRRRFVMDRDNKAGTPRRSTRVTASARDADPDAQDIIQPMTRLDQVRPYVMQELEMAQRFRRNLLEWMARYPQQRPRALMLISGGFEYDPAAYYFGFSQSSKDAQQAREEFSQHDLGSPISQLAKTLAASSWTMISVDAPAGAGDQWIDDSGRSGIGRIRNLRTDDPGTGSAFSGTRTRDPLLEFADATGGSVVQRGQIAATLADLGRRVKITYQVSRPPDGKAHRVAVRTKLPGVTVRTMKWSSEATPDDIAAVRAVSILRDGGPLGELPTSVNVEWTPGTTGRRTGNIVVKSSLAPVASLASSRSAAFRVSILAREAGQQPMLIHRIVSDYDPSKGTFVYTAPITAPASKLELVIAVEELSTGIWGGARAMVQ